MEKSVQELKILIRELILEIADLKERVATLERAGNSEPQIRLRSEADLIKLRGEGYEQLGQLYNEGYHVCPIAYGQIRSDGCLFCIAFMEKE
ncbi:MAG: initiation control protein YabA [Syntrophomonas sp.]|nr:initiation control protein YabA [Syntrophomonas sp.]